MKTSRDDGKDRATLAHDLSQPVQAIELYASGLSRRVDSDEARQMVERIREAVAQIRHAISQFERG